MRAVEVMGKEEGSMKIVLGWGRTIDELKLLIPRYRGQFIGSLPQISS